MYDFIIRTNTTLETQCIHLSSTKFFSHHQAPVDGRYKELKNIVEGK
jgi:hypothetical protein